MGPFLVQPLLEELQTVAESPAPLHDGRRLLEVCAQWPAPTLLDCSVVHHSS